MQIVENVVINVQLVYLILPIVQNVNQLNELGQHVIVILDTTKVGQHVIHVTQNVLVVQVLRIVQDVK